MLETRCLVFLYLQVCLDPRYGFEQFRMVLFKVVKLQMNQLPVILF